MTAIGIVLAFVVGGFFVYLGRRPPRLASGRPSHRAAARSLQVLYLLSGVSLIVRGVIALSSITD
jgi:hypothetical protein